MQYNYISAGAGAGKTAWAITTSTKFNYNGNNVLFIVPTIDLANSIERRSGGKIQAIHSNNTFHPVDAIRSMFETQAKRGSVPSTFVITEASFLLLGSYRHAAENWIIIKDEALEPLTFVELQVPDSVQDIHRWFNFMPLDTGKPTDKLFRAIGIGQQCPKTTDEYDAIYGEIHKLKELIKNSYVNVVVNHAKLDYDEPKLAYSVFQKPELYADFAEVYFMSANFDHTFLFQMWQHYGVQWVDKTPSKMKLLANPPSNRVHIHYWLEDKSWSDYLRNKTIGNQTYLEAYFEWFKQREPGKDYVYSINNKYKYRLPGEIMPAVCHGLNDWNHYTKFMTCASYLISNSEEATYQYYGSSTTDARGLRQTQMIYQQLMRTDLRNYDSTQPIDLYVPTLSEARDLLIYLPEATIMDLHKTKPGEATGITANLKADWVPDIEPEEDTAILPISYMYGDNVADKYVKGMDLNNTCSNHSTNKLISSHIPTSIIRTQAAGQPKKSRSHPFLDAIRNLELQAPVTAPEAWKLDKETRNKLKANLPFFVTGQFNEGDRLLKDKMLGNNDLLAFDIDGEDITNLQISKVFTGIEHLIYTTMSHNPDAKKRNLRVIVACNRSMTVGEHTRLMKYYLSKLEKLIKVDTSKITPYSKFFWPHQESEITHVYRNKELLDVDCVLADIPKQPVVRPPRMDNLDFHYPPGKENQYNKKKISECMDILNKMVQGDRTNKALSIAGKMKNLLPDEKDQLYQLIVLKGVDTNTLKTVKRFAQM